MSRKLAVVTIVFNDPQGHIEDTSDLALAVEASLMHGGFTGVDVTAYSNPFALLDNVLSGHDPFSKASQAESVSVPDRRGFTVEGAGEFPRDMLRYDDAVPADEQSSLLVNAKDGDPLLYTDRDDKQHLRKYQVNLVSSRPEDHLPGPATARWESFGFRVIKIGDAFLGQTSAQLAEQEKEDASPRL